MMRYRKCTTSGIWVNGEKITMPKNAENNSRKYVCMSLSN